VCKSPLSLLRERVGVRASVANALILNTLILTFSLEGRRNNTFYNTLFKAAGVSGRTASAGCVQ